MNTRQKTADDHTAPERRVDPPSSSQAENPETTPPAFIRCVRTTAGGVEAIFADDPRPAPAQQPEPFNNAQLLFPYGSIDPRDNPAHGG